MRRLLTILLLGIYASSISQAVYNPYQDEMNLAYEQYPNIPKGMLEAISFNTTHFSHITEKTQESCFGLPRVFGVMGLTENGKGYFNNNLLEIARYSGYTVEEIKSDPQLNILAYARSYSFLVDSLHATTIKEQQKVLELLSEIPNDNNLANIYALNCHTYSIFSFLRKEVNQIQYNFPDYRIDLADIYGQKNYEILSSSTVNFAREGIVDENGNIFTVTQQRTAEYGPALWVATPSCNYSSRSGTPISAVTIHTIQGTYAGAISWAQNCNANVSYHYVVRSSDGQITQMLLEADKGWHVGSENPYCIGIEHDGYVDDPSWYTPALYNASADLCRDISQSGYGINPLRTYFGDPSAGLNTLGSCVKIKGHQHYPNQSHTDPGINWNWEAFYKLINNNPTYNNFTTGSGTLYDSGGAAGNYSDDERSMYLIEPLNAATVTINFNMFNLEQDWDFLFIYDGSTPNAPLLGKYTGTTSPGTVTSTGGSILLEFRSDCATTAPGWEIAYSSTQQDINPPTTKVNTGANWQTADFNVSFTDNDDVMVADSFYQVADFDGAKWTSNTNFGFFNDEFDQTLSPDWTSVLGTWSTNAGVLEQTDEAEGNSNLYASLDQSGGSYVYHWKGQINGSGVNRRAGMHFICDDPTLNQRGNSYMVYWRVDQDKCQIYEVNNNTISLMTDDDVIVDPNTWYDFKIYYNSQTGNIKAFLNDVLVSQWTDSTPLTTGNSISLRTGNCIGIYEDLKVYKSRSNSELVTIGTGNEIRFQNLNSTTPSGRITSLAIDANNNWSVENIKTENIDWTQPADMSIIDDGTAADIDTTSIGTELSANWNNSSDQHSDVLRYWYAIGTTTGGNDIVDWTDNGTSTSVTHIGLSLVAETIYYFSVKAENGAGLLSNVIISDGQRYVIPSTPPVANFQTSTTTICNGDVIQLTNTSTDATSYSWSTSGGTLSSTTATNPTIAFSTSGTYTVDLTATGPGGTDVSSQNINVTILQDPVADATPSATTVQLPSATVSFTNNSSNTTSYSWSFGDGNTSTAFEPSNTYTSAGFYTVMYTASNGVCTDSTIEFTIEVIDPAVPPTANFATSGTTICQGENIQLTNNSTDATSYSWSTSGGTLSSTTAVNPTIAFTASGSYTIDLTATGPGGSDVSSQSINVNIVNPPIASATPSATSINTGDAVSFTNTSSNANAYNWVFGDGNSSSQTDPSHTYSASGTYNVMLIAINGSCSNDTTYFTITVTDAGVVPVADFSTSSTTICNGDALQLYNNSTNATSYNWTTTGGTLSSTTAFEPTISFSNSGAYTIDLTATGPGGTNTSSQTFNVNVVNIPVASATPSATTITTGNTINFSNTSSNANTYYWNFGDGNNSSITNPSHTYTTSGTYQVMLIAMNGTCSNDTTYFSIVVNDPAAPPVADFTTSSTTVCNGEAIQLYNNSTNATSYSWSSSGGTLSSTTAFEPTITFSTSGSYTIDLSATGTGGTNNSSQTLNITVTTPPTAAFVESSSVVYLPNATVNFTNNSSNATSYFWDFGDGNTSSSNNPNYTYSAQGTYTVMLVAMNGSCANDTVYTSITVESAQATPVASFTLSSTTVCAGSSIQLSNSSTDATSYQWSSTGGSFSSTTAFEPTITFNSSGSYSISLTATGAGGSDSYTNNVTIAVQDLPIASAVADQTVVYLPNSQVLFSSLSTNATDYFWDFGDGATSTGENPWHLYSASGIYNVQLTASNDACGDDTDIIQIIVYGAVGIDEQENEALLIYPNPSNGIIQLSIDNIEEAISLSLFDISGKLITVFTQNDIEQKTIDLNHLNLEKGYYLFRLTTEKSIYNNIIFFQ